MRPLSPPTLFCTGSLERDGGPSLGIGRCRGVSQAGESPYPALLVYIYGMYDINRTIVLASIYTTFLGSVKSERRWSCDAQHKPNALSPAWVASMMSVEDTLLHKIGMLVVIVVLRPTCFSASHCAEIVGSKEPHLIRTPCRSDVRFFR